MRKMSKGEFWDAISDKYPEEFADFAEYVDEYKRREGWSKLFDERIVMGMGRMITKYHDLPNAMQLGIFIQYTVESGLSFIHPEFIPQIMDDYIGSIEAWFVAVRELNSIKH